MLKRFLNRRFIRALAALITTLIVVFRPKDAGRLTEAAMNITAALTAVLSATGFLYRSPDALVPEADEPDTSKKGDVP